MGVCCKERHLAFRIATVGAVGVGLDEFPDGKAIRRFGGRNGNVLAHGFSLLSSYRASLPD
jgi:hypothetical protein